MSTALIVGISGQDGAYLARFLISKGYQVIGTSRDKEMSTFDNLVRLGIKDDVSLCSMDASDFRSVITTLKRYRPREVYNLAGQSSVGMSFDYPIETFNSILIGTTNILECIRVLDYETRFYNAGSGEVFGSTPSPANESTSFRPLSPYATAKAAANFAVANYRDAYGMFACSGILFNHESPLRPRRFVTSKIVDALKRISRGSREKINLGNIDITRDWGWAPDYVEAMWLMLQNPTPMDFVIATGKSHSLRDFLDTSFGKYSLDWSRHVHIDSNLFRPLDIEVSLADPTLVREKLQWRSKIGFCEMIERLIGEEF